MDEVSEGPATMVVSHAELRTQVHMILRAWGLPEEDIDITVDAIVEADLCNIDSHGVSMLPLYDQMRRNGRLNLAAAPRVVRETAATALIDADAGLGHAVSVRAMRRAAEMSRTTGCAIVAVRNSHHFGAAGVYARIAADMGAIGIVTSSTRFVTRTGARHQPYRLCGTRRKPAAGRARHGDDQRGRQQGEGLLAEGARHPRWLGGRRQGPAGDRFRRGAGHRVRPPGRRAYPTRRHL